MSERLEAYARAMAARRMVAILEAVAAAELPPGCTAERGTGTVAIRGAGLVRRLAFDARLRALALIARDA